MSMGKRRREQSELFVPHTALTAGPGHPFYQALERLLRKHQFDEVVEELCQPFYPPRAALPAVSYPCYPAVPPSWPIIWQKVADNCPSGSLPVVPPSPRRGAMATEGRTPARPGRRW